MIDNGLWKMNTNGTGIARLITNQAGQFSGLNNFSQFPWSNVSRNGSMYAVQVTGNQIQALQVGSLAGGAPTTFDVAIVRATAQAAAEELFERRASVRQDGALEDLGAAPTPAP